MKARKLIKDNTTKKQNIVFFGSYGYEPKMATQQCELIEDSINGIYFNILYLNLFFNKTISDQFITITSNNNTNFTWTLQFNGLKQNKNETVKISGSATQSCQISINSLIESIEEYDMLSSFILTISVESANPITDIFTIDYPTKESKLAYDKNKYGPKNPYTYLESQEFNYAGGGLGVKYSLIPRLSVIKGELWYKASYGLPLMDKIKNKGIYDSIIVKYITDQPDVSNLEEFVSTLDKNAYVFNCKINTVYAENVELSNE